MTDEKFLRKSQQGELDAVPMYNKLAKKFEKKNPEVSEMLKSMAADEGKHALFFKNISGEVLIGEGVYCGTGVKIINQTTIGEYAVIGAGAVVTKPIPGYCTAVGVPAKVVK